jgi:putative nucleotidyltransferase with HDIG domain
MQKIVQKEISHSFVSVKPSDIVIGSVLDFDCYIKRYNGYVVIVEKGTEITQHLYEKISQHQQIYIHRLEQEKYRQYAAEHHIQISDASIENNIMARDLLEKIMESTEPPEKKIADIYLYAYTIMNKFFASECKELDLKEVDVYIQTLIKVVSAHSYKLEQFVLIMPDEFHNCSHSVNVSILSTLLAKELNMTQHQLYAISLAALLHDIGNCAIQQDVLKKSATLTLDEFELVQTHVKYSVMIAKSFGINDSKILTAIKSHHEKLDGSGYPERLEGNQIPVMAQIIAVCDIFDALTTDRSYRKKYSSFDALMLMKTTMHKQLNSRFIKHLIRILH